MLGDSAKPYPLLPGRPGIHCQSNPSSAQGFGRPTFPPLQAIVFGGLGYWEGLEAFPTLLDTAPSLWCGDGGMDLGCQGSPAPGHVCPVEVEESVSMMRADSGHWGQALAPQAREREAGGKAPPTPLPSLHHGDHNRGDGIEAGLTSSHIPHTCTHTYMLTPPANIGTSK